MDEKIIQGLVWQKVFEEITVFEFEDWLNRQAGSVDLNDPYEKCRITANICCPRCFEPVKATYSTCPECGLIWDVSIMITLRDNAIELGAFAWNYRERYEKDAADGKFRQDGSALMHFLPPPADWLVYIASLALAGMIGGLAYDGFKKLVFSAKTSFRKRFSKELPSEEWLQKFYGNLQEYYLGIQDTNSPILRAYMEGLIMGRCLRAEFKHSPDFESNLIKTERMIMENMDSGTSEIKIPSRLSNGPPSEAELKEYAREAAEEYSNKATARKKLRNYLSRFSEKKNG